MQKTYVNCEYWLRLQLSCFHGLFRLASRQPNTRLGLLALGRSRKWSDSNHGLWSDASPHKYLFYIILFYSLQLLRRWFMLFSALFEREKGEMCSFFRFSSSILLPNANYICIFRVTRWAWINFKTNVLTPMGFFHKFFLRCLTSI